MKIVRKMALLGIAGLLAAQTSAQTNGNMLQLVEESYNHSTLYEAIKSAELETMLTGKGPYTLFAPTNDAFTHLPAGDWEELKHSEKKRDLTDFINYHVVEGRYSEQDLRDAIRKGNGEAKLKTVSGGKLTFRLVDNTVVVTDAQGHDAALNASDMTATNGVVYIVDSVFLKK